MKKIMVLLLLLVSSNVFAEWTKVDVSENDILFAYVDYATIKRKGNKVTMLKIYDFKTEENVGNDRYLSVVNRDEYDCEEKTSRITDFVAYSRNMGKGDVVYSEKNLNDKADSVSPGSMRESLLIVACGKK